MLRAFMVGAVCCFVEGCSAAPQAAHTFALEQEFTAYVGTPLRHPAEGLTLTVTEIADSRCPEGVTCVWEGDAIATVVLQKAGSEATLALHTNPKLPSEGMALGYRVKLLRVEPYPKDQAPVPRSAYRVTLVVSRANA